jgi:hypothetical protein
MYCNKDEATSPTIAKLRKSGLIRSCSRRLGPSEVFSLGSCTCDVGKIQFCDLTAALLSEGLQIINMSTGPMIGVRDGNSVTSLFVKNDDVFVAEVATAVVAEVAATGKLSTNEDQSGSAPNTDRSEDQAIPLQRTKG